ncbi:MAG: hypothetical protein NUV98_01360 [Candidatus Roizmanbacteria bacterium]|nr:hypothetical protein [Candidatus Roizmanbacteria bacterium]
MEQESRRNFMLKTVPKVAAEVAGGILIMADGGLVAGGKKGVLQALINGETESPQEFLGTVTENEAYDTLLRRLIGIVQLGVVGLYAFARFRERTQDNENTDE